MERTILLKDLQIFLARYRSENIFVPSR